MKINLKILLYLIFLQFSFLISKDILPVYMPKYRSPSARSEALGKNLITVNNGVYSILENPAAVYKKTFFQLSYSYSNKYYEFNNAKFTFIGISLKIMNLGIISFSDYYFFDGGKYLTSFLNEKRTEETNKFKTNLYTISYSNNILENFKIGVNFNYFKFSSEIVNSKSTNTFDIGMVYNLMKTNQHQFNIALVFKNIFPKDVDIIFNDPLLQIFNSTGQLPSEMSIGMSYYSSKIKNIEKIFQIPMSALLNISYKDLLNAKTGNQLSLGSEIGFKRILFLRIGYYYEKLINDHINNLTYGIGVHFPLRKFGKYTPFDFKIDFCTLPQPAPSKNINKNENFINIGININF